MPTVCREPVPAWKVIPCVGARVMQSTTMEPNLIDFDKAFVVVNPAALLKGMAGAYGSMAMKTDPPTHPTPPESLHGPAGFRWSFGLTPFKPPRRLLFHPQPAFWNRGCGCGL